MNSTSTHKPDIATRANVQQLIETFYVSARVDELLDPFFRHLDFEHHIPRMVSFWTLILLDEEGYKGNVFDRHAHLNISGIHFERWLALFIQSVDCLYEGERAELAKQKATLLKYTFQSKMEAIKGNTE